MTQPILKLLLLASILVSVPALSESINVAVAANFKVTLQALKPVFEKQSGHHLNIISSGTGHLSNQIFNGAPFDIFLAANKKHPRAVFAKLKDKRQLTRPALQPYALGRLALFSAKPMPHRQLAQLLSGPTFSKLALANAKLAPYGLAAQQTLQHLNLKTKWQGKLIRGQNVAQVYQFVHTKNVDAGFVAYSMIKQLPGVQFIEVPQGYYDPIEQVALRLNNKKISVDFMTFLFSEHAQNIILKQGYQLPKPRSNKATH